MKRQSTAEPLTPDDIAERLSTAMLRTWRILLDVRQNEDLWDAVKHSRYLVVMPSQLIEELQRWTDHPDGLSSEPPAGPII